MCVIKKIIFLQIFVISLVICATDSVASDGPLFFKANGTKRIFQAFDLPHTEIIKRQQTFADEDMTPVIQRLDALKEAGYTHVQISPPQACTPSFSSLTPHKYCYEDIWYLPYQPYICILDDNYRKELSELFGTTEDLRPKYGITLSDGTIIGYRVGNTRYGTAKQLKELVTAAKQKGLGIIVDIVINHVSPDHGGAGTYFETMRICDLHPIRCEASGGYSLSELNFPENFFHERAEGEYGLETWDWGPDLNTGNATTQDVIVKYIKILSDLGVTGLRFDAMKHIAASEFHAIFHKAKASIGVDKFFDFGFGEMLDGRDSELIKYHPLAPLEDVKIFQDLINCFAKKQSVKQLIAPNGLGNVPAVAFSTLHDHYPTVSDGDYTPFYPNGDAKDSANIINSQMAMAYLLARKDPSVLIFRFEGEQDICGLIKRGLHFRKTMEAKKAPHEYMFALNDDVLVIARQFGFAVINKSKHEFRLRRANIRGSDQLVPFYIPDGTYQTQDGATCTVPELDFCVHPRNVSFFMLNDSSGQRCIEKVFECAKKTNPDEKIVVIGNHPLLGNYDQRPDGFNTLLSRKSYTEKATYASWKSICMSFPETLPLKYSFALVRENGHFIEDDVTSLKACGKSRIFFSLTNTVVPFGQDFYIIGNTEILGNWNPENALPMYFNEKGKCWCKSVFFPANVSVEYKYIKKAGKEIIWLSGANLSLSTADTCSAKTDIWNDS